MLLEPAATISPLHHHRPGAVPPGYFTQGIAPRLCKQQLVNICDSTGDHFSGGLASSRIGVPESEREGFLQRKLVGTREERRTITYLSLRKLGQSGTRLPKPFHSTVIARMYQSNYSVLLQTQQGSGTQQLQLHST